MASPKLICLTPCRNENWVIDIHLQAAAQWADHIIIGDQMSDDGTRETVARHTKALLVDNLASGYDEGERHRVVFEAARKIPGDKILFAIDADEVFSANWQESLEWQQMLCLKAGTAIYAQWVNLDPDFQTWFPFGNEILIGYVDDGRISHSPGKFHVPRLLPPPGAPRFVFRDVRLLHYQFTDALRSQSKNRAYQVQEWIETPRRPIRLFRRFNAALQNTTASRRPLDPAWVDGFSRQGLDWKGIKIDGIYRWDIEVLMAILEYGAAFFCKLDLWNVKWVDIAERSGIDTKSISLCDPRSPFERAVHSFLRRTQSRMSSPFVRLVQLALRLFGW